MSLTAERRQEVIHRLCVCHGTHAHQIGRRLIGWQRSNMLPQIASSADVTVVELEMLIDSQDQHEDQVCHFAALAIA